MVSYRQTSISSMQRLASLNPCCNGRWSRTAQGARMEQRFFRVLILVVMEDGLVHANGEFVGFVTPVLILVVMEDGLVLDLIRLY